jgi:hypothetical protein
MTRSTIAWCAAAATLLFHAIANPHYGFFRDELYFIICGRHPDWGYVDQPPLVPLMAAASQVFGQSLFLLRFEAAIFAAAAVYVTCRLVQHFGGGAFAQIFAAVCVALSPVLVAFGMKVGTDMPGLWLWPLGALCMLRALDGRPRYWLGVGIAFGFAFESKYSVLFFVAALLVGLLAAREWRAFATKWFWAGAGLCVAIALPNGLWQAAHGFPMAELLRNGQQGKNVVLGPVQYVLSELLITNPLLSLAWIAGLVWLLMQPRLRWIGYAYLALLLMMIAFRAKHYYPADIYPVLFAAGGVALERWTAVRVALRPVLTGLALLAGFVLLPRVVPILPIDMFIAYQRALPLDASSETHRRRLAVQQDWADMFGWPEMVATVAGVYQGLPAADRAKAAIVAGNYGEAAAVDFFGGRYGLPPALSGHNQYFLWGPRGYDGSVVIRIGSNEADLRNRCHSFYRAATFSHPLVMPFENDLPIFVCRGLKMPLSQLWPQTKFYY